MQAGPIVTESRPSLTERLRNRVIKVTAWHVQPRVSAGKRVTSARLAEIVNQQLIQRVILPFSGDVQIRRSHTEANESTAFQNPL